MNKELIVALNVRLCVVNSTLFDVDHSNPGNEKVTAEHSLIPPSSHHHAYKCSSWTNTFTTPTQSTFTPPFTSSSKNVFQKWRFFCDCDQWRGGGSDVTNAGTLASTLQPWPPSTSIGCRSFLLLQQPYSHTHNHGRLCHQQNHLWNHGGVSEEGLGTNPNLLLCVSRWSGAQQYGWTWSSL